mgnify:CR=1 FL=1
MKRFFLLFLLGSFFVIMAACATNDRIEGAAGGVRAGMSKLDVIREFGQPLAITKNGDVEYLSYKDPKKPALVKIIAGKVVTVISPNADSYVTTKSQSKSYY